MSLWVSGLTREDIFWRSAISGGRATMATRRARYRSSRPRLSKCEGDITAIDPMGDLLLRLFVIECKHWRSLGLTILVFRENPQRAPLTLAWRKTIREGRPDRREPMMIVREDNQPDLLITTSRGSRVLLRGVAPGDRLVCRAVIPRLGMRIYLLNDVLVRVDFERLRLIYGRNRLI